MQKAPLLGGRWERGACSQAIGFSRGGCNSTLLAPTDGEPAAPVSPDWGEMSPTAVLPMLLDDLAPRTIMLADKTGDSNAIRDLIGRQDVVPNIPSKANRRWDSCFSRTPYKDRNAREYVLPPQKSPPPRKPLRQARRQRSRGRLPRSCRHLVAVGPGLEYRVTAKIRGYYAHPTAVSLLPVINLKKHFANCHFLISAFWHNQPAGVPIRGYAVVDRITSRGIEPTLSSLEPSNSGRTRGELAVHDEDLAMSKIFDQTQDILEAIRQESRGDVSTRAEPRFPISRAAELVGRSDSMIREAEKSGRLPQPERGENGRRVNYTLSAINHMRRVFGTMPRRGDDEKAAIVAIQNFKGGVGKSTLAVNLAQYLAIQGYRVCLVDCDSQATTTSMFGYRPDLDLDGEEDTLYGFLHNALNVVPPSMIKDTHFDGLKLLPANLDLYQAEYELAALVARAGEHGHGRLVFNRISDAIASLEGAFDVIIMDPPPALGMISLGVLAAANAMIIPVPPTIVDFSSTASFIGMALDSMKILARYRAKPVFNFVRLVASRTSENKSMQKTVLNLMQELFGRNMFNSSIKDSAEIDNASSRFKTVFELEKPISRKDVHDRCVASLTAVCSEIEVEIRKTWPSHHEGLIRAGLV